MEKDKKDIKADLKNAVAGAGKAAAGLFNKAKKAVFLFAGDIFPPVQRSAQCCRWCGAIQTGKVSDDIPAGYPPLVGYAGRKYDCHRFRRNDRLPVNVLSLVRRQRY